MYLFKKIEYDEIGNPTIYRDKTLTWSHGRRLDRFDDVEFKYNVNGNRTSKIVNGKEIKYFLSGTKLLAQTDGTNTLYFYYGADGVTGFTFNNEDYYYKKNAQNDIISIYSTNGEEVIRYFYDAWGNNITEIVDTNENMSYTDNVQKIETLARLNPFRYRSYIYDEETNLYYLNSRYYDPEVCRFINADDISTLDVTQIANNGLNLFAYCLNNPVNESDENGYFLSWLIGFIVAAVVVAFANTVVQLATDTIEYIFTGQWNSGWEDYVGAFLGGLAGGALFFLTGNIAATFGVMNGIESLTTNLLTNATGRTRLSVEEILGSAFFSAGIGALTGYLFGGSKINGLTIGRNNFLALFKSGLTKLANGNAGRMSIKVLTKGIIGFAALRYKTAVSSGAIKAFLKNFKFVLG